MNASENVQSRPWSGELPLVRVAGAAALYRLPVYLACTLVALALTLAFGKDLDWDTFNYHLYSGFSTFHDRFAQDYFPAGLQSYFNPYAYAPFYALTRSGMSAIEMGTLFAVWHSAILWLTFELAVAVCPQAPPRTRTGIGILAVALALINSVLVQQIGSSFADITTAELVMAGWLLLATAVVRAPRPVAVVAAAALLGAATALKLSNFVFAVAGAGVLLFVPLPLRGRVRIGAIYAGALAVAFTAVTAPWSYRLHRAFGNPFFPLFNDVFRSSQFTTEPLRFYRFIPSSLTEALWRPFAMLDTSSMVHDELRAPDARYAVLALLAAALLARLLWKRLRPASPRPTPPTADARATAALGCGFAVAWTLWLMTSGNSRYFLPMACVSAVLIAALVPRLVGGRARVWAPLLAALCALQLFQAWMGGAGVRWNNVSWDSGPWVDVQVPPQLAAEPALYLSIGVNSSSYLAPYVSKDAGFISFSGWYALGPDGPGGARVETLIRRYAGHLRLLAPGDRLYPDLKHLPNISDVNGALARWGLRAVPEECAKVTVVGSLPQGARRGFTTWLVSCRVVPDPSEPAAQMARREVVSLILDRMEDSCPQMFQPRRALTELRNNRWQRVYLNTDVTAWVSRGYVKWMDAVYSDGPEFLGPEGDWSKAPQRVVCGRRNGHYFTRVLPQADHP